MIMSVNKNHQKKVKDMIYSDWENKVIMELARLNVLTPPDHWLYDFLKRTILRIRKGKIENN